MDRIFDNDNTLTPDQEAIKIVSSGEMNQATREKIQQKSLATFSTNDLMELSTLGLLIAENSLLSNSASTYASYLVPNEPTDKDSGLYRVVVEDGITGLEAMCPLNQTVRIFREEETFSLREINKLSSDRSYLGKLKFARALESVWREIGTGGSEEIEELSQTMEKLFGIPFVSGSDFNTLMDSVESFNVDDDTTPAIEYFTAFVHCKRINELLNEGTLTLNEAKTVLGSLIEKFVLPTEVTAGILRGLHNDDRYKEIVENAVINKAGNYNEVLELL